jgi:hypothetical protein
MKNPYEIQGESVSITVRKAKPRAFLDAWIDLADLPKVQAFRGTWYASEARAPVGKHYVFGKQWNRETKKSTTISLHRLLFDFPPCEVHHVDNDGLNCRRLNLDALTHQANIREHWPERDWAPIDKARQVAKEYRQERLIAAQVAREFGLGRQNLWRIRRGYVTSSPAAESYLQRISAANIRPLEMLMICYPMEGKWGARIGRPEAKPQPW